MKKEDGTGIQNGLCRDYNNDITDTGCKETTDSSALLINRLAGGINGWLSRQKLDPYKFRVLYALQLCPSLTQKDLCTLCGMPKQTVGHAITWLKDQDYVELVTNPKDRRSKQLVPTEKGRAFMSEMCQPVIELEVRIRENMGEENAEMLIGLLQLYLKAFLQESRKEDAKS